MHAFNCRSGGFSDEIKKLDRALELTSDELEVSILSNVQAGAM
jgi:hypothetical protein